MAGGLGEAVLPSVGCARFEFLFPIPTAAGAAGSGAEVSVSAGGVWAVSACAGSSGHSSPLGRTLDDNAGASWWKKTRGGGLTDGRGVFLGLLDVFTHVDREPWCSRGPCRAPVVAIFR